MAYIEEVDDDAPVIEEVDEAEEAEAERKRERKQKKKKSPSSSSGSQGGPKRDGVPLTEELIRRKAEHNECPRRPSSRATMPASCPSSGRSTRPIL